MSGDWISPADAAHLAARKLPAQAALSALIDWACTGELPTRGRVEEGGEPIAIEPRFWLWRRHKMNWHTGLMIIEANNWREEPRLRRFFAVQFDANTLSDLLGLSIEGDRADDSDLPRLSESKLIAWWGGVKASGQADALTEQECLDAARATFPGNFVSRDRVRDIRGPQKRGRKPISGKASAE